MFNPTNIYTLHNTKTNTHYGLVKNDKSYIVGFQTNKMANTVRKVINVKKDLIYNSSNDCQVYLTKVCIPKKIVYSKPIFVIKKFSMNKFMELPNNKNIGVIQICEFIADMDDILEFTSMIVEPLNDIISYQMALL